MANSASRRKLICGWISCLCMPSPRLFMCAYPHPLHHAPPSPFRNFGMPMNVEPEFKGEAIWGFKVGIYKDGVKLTDIGIQVGGQGRPEWRIMEAFR